MPDNRNAIKKWWYELEYDSLDPAAQSVVSDGSRFVSPYKDEMDSIKADMYDAVSPYISGKFSSVVIHGVPGIGDVWIVSE